LAARLADMGVVVHGRLDPGQVSAQLQTASFAALAYPLAFVAKSSILAAYAAHGICPIVFSDRHEPTDALSCGHNYIPAVDPSLTIERALTIGRAAWHWYQDHTFARHVAATRDLLGIGQSYGSTVGLLRAAQ
jgi:hypothetical protein